MRQICYISKISVENTTFYDYIQLSIVSAIAVFVARPPAKHLMASWTANVRK